MKLPRTLWRQSPDFPQLWVSMEKEIVLNKTDAFLYYLQDDLMKRPRGKKLFVFRNKSNELMVKFPKLYFPKGKKYGGQPVFKNRYRLVDDIFNRTWTEFYEHLNELSSSM